MNGLPDRWVLEPLINHITSKSGDSKIIKGKQSPKPQEGLFQGFSASGADVWVPEAHYQGKGIVVSAVGARCGKTFQAEGEWTAIANTHVLVPGEQCGVDFKWLWYLTNDEDFWIRSGTAQPFVKVKDTLLRPQLIPPIDEQRRIVETLDDHTSRLNNALADLNMADSLSLAFRRSILNALLNPQFLVSASGTENTDRLPSGWSIAPLGEIADTQLGKMLNRSNQVGDATVPYLRNVNVQWGRIDMSDVKQMDIYPDEMGKFMAQPGDLLVCEGGESGRAAIWSGSSAIGIQNAIHRIRPKAGILSRYLLHYFEWQVKSRMIDHLLSGVTITHFTQEKLRKMIVQYPPIEEQHRIVQALDEQTSQLDSIRKSIESQKALLQSLRRSLLIKAFNGELGTN